MLKFLSPPLSRETSRDRPLTAYRLTLPSPQPVREPVEPRSLNLHHNHQTSHPQILTYTRSTCFQHDRGTPRLLPLPPLLPKPIQPLHRPPQRKLPSRCIRTALPRRILAHIVYCAKVRASDAWDTEPQPIPQQQPHPSRQTHLRVRRILREPKPPHRRHTESEKHNYAAPWREFRG
jgi:hypothetical protein